MTPEDRKALIALAAKATPGPWTVSPAGPCGRFVEPLGHESDPPIAKAYTAGDAAYLAALSPEAVRSLVVDANRTATAQRRAWTERMRAEREKARREALDRRLVDARDALAQGDADEDLEWRHGKKCGIGDRACSCGLDALRAALAGGLP